MPMTAGGLAKLLEELGELSQVAAKKLAYFDTDEHPDGAGSLKERLEAEMGDVIGAIDFVSITLGLSARKINTRAMEKLEVFQRWHADPGNGANAFDAKADGQEGGAA